MLRAVPLVFGEWTALKLAVENQWGGSDTRDKALALLRTVCDGLSSAAVVHRDEIEMLLDQVCDRRDCARRAPLPLSAAGPFGQALMDDFNVEAEDDSPSQVAQVLCTLHAEARQGGSATADAIIQKAAAHGAATWVDHAPPPPPSRADDSSDDDDGEEGDGGGDAMDTDQGAGGKSGGREPPQVDDEGFTMVTRSRARR